MERIGTNHEDLIHDVQLDYYGKQLATCSSDRSIKIYDIIDGGERKHVADLKGHDGPVWQIAWAHPMYGNILASCSYDRQVMVWKEHSPHNWAQVYIFREHEGSVNSISWAPKEFGLCLACASSDETIRVLTHNHDDSWGAKLIPTAHKTGVNAVSFAPIVTGGVTESGAAEAAPIMRLASGGCDNMVKLWRFSDEKGEWEAEAELPLHSDWVRDVAFAANIGGSSSIFASCSQDKKVVVWTQAAGSSEWSHKVITFGCAVWRVSWSLTGNILAVSGGDNQVTLWKDNLLGEWEQIGQLSEDGSTTKG